MLHLAADEVHGRCHESGGPSALASVADATARAELIASRARIVTAEGDARRRLARDLHDGAQQRLVSAIVSLQLADRSFDRGDAASARRLLREALVHASDGLAELRELVAGVHPRILTSHGLRPAIQAMAQRNHTPVKVDIPGERYPPHVETTTYFVVAEALTNAAKHARATKIAVSVNVDAGTLVVCIADDGIGGANPDGNGLRGLRDRVEAFGGTLAIISPPGRGTRLRVTLPSADPAWDDE